MKKAVFLFLLIAAMGTVLFAQTPAPATTTISGTLGVSAGRIAVKSGTLTYYTRGLDRFVGFIDGLKEGAQVTMEGYASAPFFEGETERFFFPVKLTLNGKTYDMGPAEGYAMGRGNQFGYGRHGRGGCGGFYGDAGSFGHCRGY